MGKERAKNIKLSKSTRSFSAIQKETAVNRVLLMNEQKSKVARDMGVPESTLRGWCKDPEKIRRLAEQSKQSLTSPTTISSEKANEQHPSPTTNRYLHTPLFPLSSEFLNTDQFVNNNNNRIESLNLESVKSKQNSDDSQKENDSLDEPENLSPIIPESRSRSTSIESSCSNNNNNNNNNNSNQSSYSIPVIPDSIRKLLEPSLGEFFTKLADPQYTPFIINTLRPYLMSIESNYRATKTFQTFFRCFSSEMPNLNNNEQPILELAGLASLKTKQCCSIDRNLQAMTATAIESFSKSILNHLSYLNLQSISPDTSIHVYMALTRLTQIIQAEFPHLTNM